MGYSDLLTSAQMDSVTECGTLFLESLAKLETFSAPKLRHISRDLRLQFVGLPDLSSFKSLEAVSGDILILNNYALLSADIDPAFSKQVAIVGNVNLKTITGFNSSTTATAITVGENYALASLTGFNGIRNLTGHYSIMNYKIVCVDDNLGPWSFCLSRNQNLTHVSGFSALSSVSESARISSHIRLVSLDGLRNLTKIGASLLISANDAIDDLGLTSLKSVGGSVVIERNQKLSNLNSLGSLESVDRLSISYNTGLTSIDAIESIKSVRRVGIYDNPNLSDCLTPLCYICSVGNCFKTEDNGPQCSSNDCQ